MSEDESGINGFCMGYYMSDNNYMKLFLKHNFISIVLKMLLLLITADKCAWRKLRSLFKKKEQIEFEDDFYKKIEKGKKVDLLSICVIPKIRGKGVSVDLMNLFLSKAKARGRDYCVLSVRRDNPRGIQFYKKNKYTLIKKMSDEMRLIKEI